MSVIMVIPKVLRDTLGDEGSAALVEMINAASAAQEKRTGENIGERLERRLAETKAELKVYISDTKAEIIKWMFVLWVTQGLLAGVVIWLLNKFAGG